MFVLLYLLYVFNIYKRHLRLVLPFKKLFAQGLKDSNGLLIGNNRKN